MYQRVRKAARLSAKYVEGLSDEQMVERIVRMRRRWYRKLVREGESPHMAYQATSVIETELWRAWSSAMLPDTGLARRTFES
jgi:hypothetical protein